MNQREAIAVSGAKKAPAARPPSTPQRSWNCQTWVVWLADISPIPSSTPPHNSTARVPYRSDIAPQKNDPNPIARKVSTAAVDTSVRDQPIAAVIGSRNTPSDMAVPRPMQVMTKPAATTTHP